MSRSRRWTGNAQRRKASGELLEGSVYSTRKRVCFSKRILSTKPLRVISRGLMVMVIRSHRQVSVSSERMACHCKVKDALAVGACVSEILAVGT